MTDIWHWIFGEADARHSSWIRERFGKHHDDSVVGHVLGSGLIKLFCLFRVFPRDFFHSFLRISIGFIHGFCVRETQEIHNRTIVRGICEAIPDLWTISKIFCEICWPVSFVAKSPYEGKTQCETAACGYNASERAGKVLNPGKRVTPGTVDNGIASIDKLHDNANDDKPYDAANCCIGKSLTALRDEGC